MIETAGGREGVRLNREHQLEFDIVDVVMSRLQEKT